MGSTFSNQETFNHAKLFEPVKHGLIIRFEDLFSVQTQYHSIAHTIGIYILNERHMFITCGSTGIIDPSRTKECINFLRSGSLRPLPPKELQFNLIDLHSFRTLFTLSYVSRQYYSELQIKIENNMIKLIAKLTQPVKCYFAELFPTERIMIQNEIWIHFLFY